MLEIGPQQLRKLDAWMRSRLRAELVAGLEGIAPDRPRDELEACADDAIALGDRLGVTRGDDFGGLASLLVDLGPDFTRHPTIAALLLDDTAPAETRIAAVFALDDDVWAEIRSDLAKTDIHHSDPDGP